MIAKLAAALVLVTALARPAAAATVDVVVQAGHEGRPASCAPMHVVACNIGAAAGRDREIAWTPIVADAATATLRAAGLTVARHPADYAAHDVARIAVFLHFDGAPPCASGASAGFPPAQGRALAARWERVYTAWFPYRFVGENITTNESRYYGFRKVNAPRKLLIEFGELTCPTQAAWLRPRLHDLGVFLGRFLIAELH
jgi:hypothetical protein